MRSTLFVSVFSVDKNWPIIIALDALHNLFRMSAKINISVKCEVRAVIQFLIEKQTILLQRYQNVGDDLCNHVLTGDEIWTAHSNVEAMQQSMQWGGIHTPPLPQEAYEKRSATKLMVHVFGVTTRENC